MQGVKACARELIVGTVFFGGIHHGAQVIRISIIDIRSSCQYEVAGKDGGCVAKAPPAGVPQFGLEQRDRDDLVAFLRDPRAPEPPAAELDRRLAQLRCLACHERNGAGGMPAANNCASSSCRCVAVGGWTA